VTSTIRRPLALSHAAGAVGRPIHSIRILYDLLWIRLPLVSFGARIRIEVEPRVVEAEPAVRIIFGYSKLVSLAARCSCRAPSQFVLEAILPRIKKTVPFLTVRRSPAGMRKTFVVIAELVLRTRNFAVLVAVPGRIARQRTKAFVKITASWLTLRAVLLR
jgi:hypothetical protein